MWLVKLPICISFLRVRREEIEKEPVLLTDERDHFIGQYREPISVGLANKREILIFPRTAGNTGIYREILGNKIDS